MPSPITRIAFATSAAATMLLASAAADFSSFDALDLGIAFILMVLQVFTLGKLFQIQKESTAVAALHQVSGLSKEMHRLKERVDDHARKLESLEEAHEEVRLKVNGLLNRLEKSLHDEQQETRGALRDLQRQIAELNVKAGLIQGA